MTSTMTPLVGESTASTLVPTRSLSSGGMLTWKAWPPDNHEGCVSFYLFNCADWPHALFEFFHQVVVAAEFGLEILYLPFLASKLLFEFECRRIFWRVLLSHARV